MRSSLDVTPRGMTGCEELARRKFNVDHPEQVQAIMEAAIPLADRLEEGDNP